MHVKLQMRFVSYSEGQIMTEFRSVSHEVWLVCLFNCLKVQNHCMILLYICIIKMFGFVTTTSGWVSRWMLPLLWLQETTSHKMTWVRNRGYRWTALTSLAMLLSASSSAEKRSLTGARFRPDPGVPCQQQLNGACRKHWMRCLWSLLTKVVYLCKI